MRKKPLALLLASIFVLFAVSTVSAEIRTDLELFFHSTRSSYVNTGEMLYGGWSRLFLRYKSGYIDIRGAITERQHSSDMEKFHKYWISAEIENSLWWKWLVVNIAYNFHEEKARFFPYNQPEDTIILEKWVRDEIKGGLGFKIGNYEKSFVRIVGITGRSFYQNKKRLEFLVEMEIEKDNSRDTIVGGDIKSRIELKLIWFDFWFDCQGSYNYYLKNKDYRIEVVLGLGIKIIKNLGIKGNVATGRTRYINFAKNYSYGAGLVLMF